MQEVFENIVKKFEELAECSREQGFSFERNGFSNTADKSYAKQCAYLQAAKIVKREAEKMGKKKTSKKGSCNCGGNCDCCNERVNTKEKIKVKSLEIIVTGTEEKPYYEIKYESLEDGLTHIGYSSFDLKNVFKWKQECFEIVKERTGKKYTVKPKEHPIVEAFQYDGDLKDSKGKYYVPIWAEEAFESGKLYYDSFIPSEQPCDLYIMGTKNIPIHVMVGDYIIKDDLGRIYNMAPENFENVFEEVVEEEVQEVL